MALHEPVARRRFFRPRFTLGALLLLITALCPPLAFIAQRRAWNKDRAEAFEKLNSRATVSLHKTPAKPQWKWISSWRTKLLGAETARIARVQFIGGSSNTFWGVRTQDVTDDAIRRLRYFPELEEVNIFVSPDLTDEGLAALGQLPNLKTLQISSCPKVKGSFFNQMKRYTKLTQLLLSNLESLEGEYLFAMERFRALDYLKLFNCKNLSDHSLRNVSLPRSVKRVSLAQLQIGDEPISRWLNQTKLSSLTLDVDITRAIAPALSIQTDLASLTILNAPLEDVDLLFLDHCANLDQLVLNGTPTQGAFLKEMNKAPPLGYVNLCSTLLTDENASYLKGFPKLHTIDLKFTPVTGDFIAAIADAPSIRSINLAGTELNDAGKNAVARLIDSRAIDLPLNWTDDDFKRVPTASLSDPNSAISRLRKARTVSGEFRPTTTGEASEIIDLIGRSPKDRMAAVIRLHDMARQPPRAHQTARRKE